MDLNKVFEDKVQEEVKKRMSKGVLDEAYLQGKIDYFNEAIKKQGRLIQETTKAEMYQTAEDRISERDTLRDRKSVYVDLLRYLKLAAQSAAKAIEPKPPKKKKLTPKQTAVAKALYATRTSSRPSYWKEVSTWHHTLTAYHGIKTGASTTRTVLRKLADAGVMETNANTTLRFRHLDKPTGLADFLAV